MKKFGLDKKAQIANEELILIFSQFIYVFPIATLNFAYRFSTSVCASLLLDYSDNMLRIGA